MFFRQIACFWTSPPGPPPSKIAKNDCKRSWTHKHTQFLWGFHRVYTLECYFGFGHKLHFANDTFVLHFKSCQKWPQKYPRFTKKLRFETIKIRYSDKVGEKNFKLLSLLKLIRHCKVTNAATNQSIDSQVGNEMVNNGMAKMKIFLYILTLGVITPIGIIVGMVLTLDAEEAVDAPQSVAVGVLQVSV